LHAGDHRSGAEAIDASRSACLSQKIREPLLHRAAFGSIAAGTSAARRRLRRDLRPHENNARPAAIAARSAGQIDRQKRTAGQSARFHSAAVSDARQPATGRRPSTAPGRELGSVLVGYFDDRELHYAGKVGRGFGGREGSQLVFQLRKHERKQSLFKEVPRADAREARWSSR
jgi:hypothetical protein